jgi:hypothetical protein
MASLSLLLSLNLNFVPTNMAPMSIDGLNALSRLRYAPVLQTLYINLDGRFGDHHTLTALVGVKDAIRLNTLHIELEKNQIGLDDARTLVSAGRTGKRLPSGQLTFGFHRTILIWDQTPDTRITYLRDNFLIIAVGLGLGHHTVIAENWESAHPCHIAIDRTLPKQGSRASWRAIRCVKTAFGSFFFFFYFRGF